MINNYEDVRSYIDTMDEKFYLYPNYEHSFTYLCGDYVPYHAVCYIQKKHQYVVQFMPTDRKINFESDTWSIIDNIEEFIWNNRYNIYYSEIPYNDLIVDMNNVSVPDSMLKCIRGAGLEVDYKFNLNRKDVEYWEVIADQVFQILIDTGKLSEEYQIYNGEKGEAVFYRVYGICNGVILFQQNNSCKNRTYGEWHTKKKYFITDGQNIEQISTPIRYLQKDGSLDGVVRYFAHKLTNECLKHKILFNKDTEDTENS